MGSFLFEFNNFKTSETRPGEVRNDRVICASASSCLACTKIPSAEQSINETWVRSRIIWCIPSICALWSAACKSFLTKKFNCPARIRAVSPGFVSFCMICMCLFVSEWTRLPKKRNQDSWNLWLRQQLNGPARASHSVRCYLFEEIKIIFSYLVMALCLPLPPFWIFVQMTISLVTFSDRGGWILKSMLQGGCIKRLHTSVWTGAWFF